jgi:hypothetical protein
MQEPLWTTFRFIGRAIFQLRREARLKAYSAAICVTTKLLCVPVVHLGRELRRALCRSIPIQRLMNDTFKSSSVRSDGALSPAVLLQTETAGGRNRDILLWCGGLLTLPKEAIVKNDVCEGGFRQ